MIEKLKPLHSCLSSPELDEAIDKLTVVLLKGYGPEITGIDAIAMLSAGMAGLRAIGYSNLEISLLNAEIMLMLKDLGLQVKEQEPLPNDVAGEPEAGKES